MFAIFKTANFFFGVIEIKNKSLKTKKRAFKLVFKWYPQANSNRSLHRESIAFVLFLGVIWIENLID